MRRALVPILAALVLFLSAGAAGYLLSSSLGEDVLRREAELQLSRLMRGDVTIERVHLRADFGLLLQGESVRVYPGEQGASLAAERVFASIDVLSLLLGQFRLRRLSLEGVHMRIERDALGDWSPYPIAALDRREGARTGDPERSLSLLRAFESATRWLLENARVASLLEIHGGRVSFVDRLDAGDEPTVRWQLLEVEAALDHRWLSRAAELSLRALFVDADGRHSRLEAEGHKLGRQTLRLTVAVTDLDVRAFGTYAAALGPEAELAGSLTGICSFETSAAGSGILELDWVVRDLVSAVPRRGAQVRLESGRVLIEARLEIHPGRLRLQSAHMRGRSVNFTASGVIERPLRESSRARLALDLRDADLPVVRRFLEALPKSDSETLLKLFANVESGRITRIGGRGETHLSEWKRLFAGELFVLPDGFLVGAEIEGLAVGTGTPDHLTDLGGTAEWSGDRIEVHDFRTAWNGEPLPTLDFVMEGVSHLFADVPEPTAPHVKARELPGIGTLQEILDRLGGPEAEGGIARPVHLEIDALHLPGLSRPIEHARATAEPIERGVQISIDESHWGPARVSGEVLWIGAPDPRLAINLETRADDPTRASEAAARVADPDAWLSGRFRMEPRRTGPLSYDDLRGRVSVVKSVVYLTQVRGTLAPAGWLEFNAGVDLAKIGALPLELSFEMEDWPLENLLGLFDLDRELATGLVHMAASIEGDLRPDQTILSGLEGFVSIAARDGEIRQKTPLVVAMAQATEGFSKVADRKSIHYETAKTILDLDHGVISAGEFEMEGPVRVFASGKLDLRREPSTVDGVFGVFLFRQADLVLGKLPLVNNLISDKGMIGAYYKIGGSLEHPEVTTLAGKTLVESVPNFLRVPFKVLRLLLKPLGSRNPLRDDAGGRAQQGGR